MTGGAQRLASIAVCGAWLTLGPLCGSSRAQGATSSGEPVESRIASTYTEETWRDLPVNSLYELAETLAPMFIPDRFTGGGLAFGQPVRLGGFFGSWTQNLFRIDGVSVTDPTGSGAALLFPELSWWQGMRITTGSQPLETNAAGAVFDLQPRMPTARWVGEVAGSTSHFFLTGHQPDSGPPAIDTLDGWEQVTAIASGPLIEQRLGAVFGGTFSRGSELHRAEIDPVHAYSLAGFGHFVLTPNDADQLRTVAVLQRVKYPFEQRTLFRQAEATTADTSAHVQAVWERRRPDAVAWKTTGSYSRRQRTPDYDPASGALLERLVDGPVGQFASVATQTASDWSVGVSVQPPAAAGPGVAHGLIAGADLDGGSAVASPFFAGTVSELVDGTPARQWIFDSLSASSVRTQRTLAGWIGDRLDISPRFRVEGGLRFEWASGSADRAIDGVSWKSWLPRANVRIGPMGSWKALLFGGYARTTDRLPLDYLAVGDPAAPTSEVYQWLQAAPPGTGATRGLLVARVGPGTGGNPAFSAIDSSLKPPISDEFSVGVELQPFSALHVRVTGFARRVHDLIALVNFGAPADTAYSVFTVQDPGGDILSPQDDRAVPIYNRFPSSFGDDRYVLTNQTSEGATYEALEISLRFETARFLLFGGGAAGLAEGPAGNRGYGPLENDQTLAGELWSDPNAGTYARGRYFTDRAFTGKLAAILKLPSDVRLGLIARYQDGQPFARMLILAVNQGTEPVRAFANGDSRFTFVGTLDARLQKRFTFGSKALELVLDGYNLLNMSNSVEEDVAAGPNVRLSTAVQPPRSFRVGLRARF